MDGNTMPWAEPCQSSESTSGWDQHPVEATWGQGHMIDRIVGDQYAQEQTEKDLFSTDFRHMEGAEQPPPYYGPPWLASAMNEDTVGMPEFESMSRDDGDDELEMSVYRGFCSDAFEVPRLNVDHAVDSPSNHVPQEISYVGVAGSNLAPSPVSPNRLRQHVTHQAYHRSWSPVQMNPSDMYFQPVPDYKSSLSSMGRLSSPGILSSTSVTRAAGTSETSENFDYFRMRDSNMTERPLMISPGLSPGVGDGPPSWETHPEGLPMPIGLQSRFQTPQHFANHGEQSSRASRPQLAANASDVRPDSPGLECEDPGCFRKFTGTHRRGTMHRHMRLKHGGQVKGEKNYPCKGFNCTKTFKRQDARLKHHRSKHPELMVAAATPRKKRQSL